MINIDSSKIYYLYKSYSIKYKLIYLLSYVITPIIVFLGTKYFIFEYNGNLDVNLKTVSLLFLALFSTNAFYLYVICINIFDFCKIGCIKTSLILDLESNTYKHLPFRLKSDFMGIFTYSIYYSLLIANFISLAFSNSYMFIITYSILAIWSIVSVGMVSFERYEKPILSSNAKDSYLFLKRYNINILEKYNLYGKVSKENKLKIINEINNNKNMAKINAFIYENKAELSSYVWKNYFTTNRESVHIVKKMVDTFSDEYVKIFKSVLKESKKSTKKENKLVETNLVNSFEKFMID